jgi:hypothetical protein
MWKNFKRNSKDLPRTMSDGETEDSNRGKREGTPTEDNWHDWEKTVTKEELEKELKYIKGNFKTVTGWVYVLEYALENAKNENLRRMIIEAKKKLRKEIEKGCGESKENGLANNINIK